MRRRAAPWECSVESVSWPSSGFLTSEQVPSVSCLSAPALPLSRKETSSGLVGKERFRSWNLRLGMGVGEGKSWKGLPQFSYTPNPSPTYQKTKHRNLPPSVATRAWQFPSSCLQSVTINLQLLSKDPH